MLHVISARCVARDLHTIAPGPLGVRVGDSSQLSEEIVKNLESRLWMRVLLLLLKDMEHLSFFSRMRNMEKFKTLISAFLLPFSMQLTLEISWKKNLLLRLLISSFFQIQYVHSDHYSQDLANLSAFQASWRRRSYQAFSSCCPPVVVVKFLRRASTDPCCGKGNILATQMVTNMWQWVGKPAPVRWAPWNFGKSCDPRSDLATDPTLLLHLPPHP